MRKLKRCSKKKATACHKAAEREERWHIKKVAVLAATVAIAMANGVA